MQKDHLCWITELSYNIEKHYFKWVKFKQCKPQYSLPGFIAVLVMPESHRFLLDSWEEDIR